MTQSIPTKIAGIFNYPEGKEPLKATVSGDELILEREPTNAYDPNAIAVYIKQKVIDLVTNSTTENRVKIGYVPRPIAAQIKDATIIHGFKGDSWDSLVITVG